MLIAVVQLNCTTEPHFIGAVYDGKVLYFKKDRHRRMGIVNCK